MANKSLTIIATVWLFAILHTCKMVEGIGHCQNLTSSSRINLSCPNKTYRIEVLAVIYARRENQLLKQTCMRSVDTNDCSAVFKEGRNLRNTLPFYRCSGFTGNCNFNFLLPFNVTECIPINFVYTEYSCIPVSDIVNLCGDEERRITSQTHLAYFPTPRNQTQNCSCVVQGGIQTLRAVDVGFPCEMHETLNITWANTTSTHRNFMVIPNQARYANEYMVRNSTMMLINYTKNCSGIARPVWFKILPEGGSQPTIYCGKSVENISSTANTSSTPSTSTNLTTATMGTTSEVYTNDTESTEAEANTTLIYQTNFMTSVSTEETTNDSVMFTESYAPTSALTPSITNISDLLSEKRKKVEVGLIIGCTIGGLAFIVIILVPFIIYYRMRRNRKKPPSIYDRRFEIPNGARYENVQDAGSHAFDNDGFSESETECTNDYHQLRDRTTTTFQSGNSRGLNNKHMDGACSRNDNDAAAADVYDHIQSDPSVQPKNTDHPPDQDDTYNLLYQNHNRAAAENVKPPPRSAKSEPPAAAIYSEIPDTDVSIRPKEQSSKPRTNSYTYSVVDKSKFKATKNSTEGNQTPFYHALEKQPVANGGIQDGDGHAEHKERGLDESVPKVNHLNGRQFVNKDVCEIADDELYESANNMNTDENTGDVNSNSLRETEFVDNELYESADNMNTDENNGGVNSDSLRETEFVDNELYESADNMNTDENNEDVNRGSLRETEFVDNELYESADNMNTDENNEDVNRGSFRETEFVDNELYESADNMNTDENNGGVNSGSLKETEFVDNDLYESADNMNTDENNRGVNSGSLKETEFVDNDLYESSDNMNSQQSRHARNKAPDSYKDIEFVDNDLYQSADQM